MDSMILAKVTIVLLLTLAVSHLVRRTAAVTRHRLWTVAFLSILTLPLLARTMPTFHVPVPETFNAIAIHESTSLVPDIPEEHRQMAEQTEPAAIQREEALRPTGGAPAREPAEAWFGADRRAGSIVLIVWFAGTVAGLVSLCLSLSRVRRLATAAAELDDPWWQGAASQICVRLGMRRMPRLLVSHDVSSPMAGGLVRPAIFLPATIDGWSAEQRDVVLAHEIAHLAGGDPLRHALARVAVALYWFHPFVWIAAWQSAVAREQACDEAVIALGTRPSVYARILMDLATSVDPPVSSVAAMSMAERSLLETRLMRILTNDALHINRRRIFMPAIAVAALTLPLAAAQPGQPARVADVPHPPVVAIAAKIAASAAPAAPEVAAAPAPGAQAAALTEAACAWSGSGGSSIQLNATERLIQQTFGHIQLCMVALDAGERTHDRPSQWIGRARRVVIEARQGNAMQRLEIVRTGGAEELTWHVGGAQRPFDAAAQRWRDRVLALFDTTWEISTLHGEVASLRGETASVRGRASSLRGEISSLRGHVSSLRGRAASARGEEHAMRGRIASIRGEHSAMRGALSAERGAMSAVNGSRYGASASELEQIGARIKRHEAEIARVEQAMRAYDVEGKIAEVQRQLDAFDADRRVAAIEAEIAAFDLDGKVGAIERRIAELDVEGRVAGIERQIDALDADRRAETLRQRRQAELDQLEAAIADIR